MKFDQTLNSNNDLEFGSINTVEGINKVKQQIMVRLKLFRGEWDYNTSIGIPYFQSILGKKNVDLVKIFSFFLTEIEKINDVLSASVVDFDFTPATHKLSIKFDIKTVYGNVIINNSI